MGEHDDKGEPCLHCFLKRAIYEWIDAVPCGEDDDLTDRVVAGIAGIVADLSTESRDEEISGRFIADVFKEVMRYQPVFRAEKVHLPDDQLALSRRESETGLDAFKPDGKAN